MAQYNTESNLNSLHKEIYAGQIEKLMPSNRLALDLFKFSEADAIGDKYIQPVQLTHEHGFSTGSGAFSLNDHVAASYADAQVDSKMVVLRSAVAYEAAMRMTSSKKAFGSATETLYSAMMESLVHRAEVLARYGGRSLGVVDSNTSGALVITAATWAPGIWQGLEGCTLEAFTAVTGGSQHNGDLVISAVDVDTRTITVTGTSAAVAAGDFLFFKGFRGNEMNGLDAIINNTGTLYNISASSYSLWKSQTLSASSAALTMAKVLQAAGKIASRGCKDELVALVANKTFENLNTDQAALRRYSGEYNKKGESGFEELAFHGQTGVIRVIADTMTKEGESFIVPPKRIKRIGSTDITFKRPGRSEDQVWLELPSNAGYEVRAMFSFNMFAERPAYLCKITGIVNS
jgi:hypothetical protein